MHVALYEAREPGRAPGRRAAGSSFPGFYVLSLDAALAALTAQRAPVLVPHEVCDWGCRVVVEDPDGRPVEVNQRGHCPAG